MDWQGVALFLPPIIAYHMEDVPSLELLWTFIDMKIKEYSIAW